MMRKMYEDQTNVPKLIPIRVLSDNEYVLYYKFMPEA